MTKVKRKAHNRSVERLEYGGRRKMRFMELDSASDFLEQKQLEGFDAYIDVNEKAETPYVVWWSNI